MKDSFYDVGFAKLDFSRSQRTGIPETIFCAGKTKEQLLDILVQFHQRQMSVLGTRCSLEQFEYIKQSSLPVVYNDISRVLVLKGEQEPEKHSGVVAVCSGGTADMPVAEEAASVAEFLGAAVNRYYDVGVAGIHRLFAELDKIRQADVVIAVAGMEGALACMLAGLVKSPVIAVPTSVGYGAAFQGIAPLLTMLNSCAEGVFVVNIDNGFGAAVQAYRILGLKEKEK